MDIDWKRLGEVRERQKTAAQQRVASDRQALEQSQQQALKAQEQWHREVLAKEQLWRETASGASVGVAHLRQSGAWSRALDARIAEARAAVAQAVDVVKARQATLDGSRHVLREAAGDLEKARQMQRKAAQARQRLTEQRMEDNAEEVAVQGWLSRRV
nr:serine kinase [uncultured Caldimonas sp.]